MAAPLPAAAAIVGHDVVPGKLLARPYARYHILVTPPPDAGGPYTVARRFRAFEDLHHALAALPADARPPWLPPLPARTYGKGVRDAVITKRTAELGLYLEDVLKAAVTHAGVAGALTRFLAQDHSLSTPFPVPAAAARHGQQPQPHDGNARSSFDLKAAAAAAEEEDADAAGAAAVASRARRVASMRVHGGGGDASSGGGGGRRGSSGGSMDGDGEGAQQAAGSDGAPGAAAPAGSASSASSATAVCGMCGRTFSLPDGGTAAAVAAAAAAAGGGSDADAAVYCSKQCEAFSAAAARKGYVLGMQGGVVQMVRGSGGGSNTNLAGLVTGVGSPGAGESVLVGVARGCVSRRRSRGR
jgi:hypothetical protein